jgi:hypothetical protein
MNRYEQPIKMAPRDSTGLIGKVKLHTSSVADSVSILKLRAGSRLKAKRPVRV